MSKKKSQQPKSSKIPDHQVDVVIRDGMGGVILACGRNPPVKDEDDSVHVVATQDGRRATIDVTLDEAEDFFDQGISLVADSKKRPVGGTIFIDTDIGDGGARLDLSVSDPNDYRVKVHLQDGDGEISLEIERNVFERFLFAALDGICPDVEDDD